MKLMDTRAAGCDGFSLIEALVGMVVGAIVLAAAYSLWSTHQESSFLIGKKIDAQNELTLASKRLQRAVTLAGFGLGGAANLDKDDAVGTDTLVIYRNPNEQRSTLVSDAASGATTIQVDNPSPFVSAGYVAIARDGLGEIRRIASVSGSTIELVAPFGSAYPALGSLAYPAERERYYTDQDSAIFVREVDGEPYEVARSVKNFQVSFLDGEGEATATLADVRSVRFSLTGTYPAKEGALNSMNLSSTAIPRNML